MNKKRKLRVLWLHEWQLEEHEAWFADMARRGWKLERLKLWVAVFVESEPEEVSYRIEIADKNKEIESDRIHLYDDAGWEYVDSRRYMYVFREKQANKGIEIHSDSVHQAETMEILKKSIKRTGNGLIYLTLFMIALVILQLMNMTSHDLLRNSIFPILLVIIIYVPLTINWLLGLNHISSLIKRMRQGDGLNHEKNYRGKRNRNRIASFVVGGVYVGLFVYLIVQNGNFNNETRFPPIPETELPVVALTDVEEVDLSQVTYRKDGVPEETQNYLAERASMFFPNQYILRQRFVIPDSANGYEPSISSRKYEGITEGLAERLVALLREEEHTAEPFMEVTITGFDEVWILDYLSPNIRIIARNKKDVYDIYYNGSQPSKVFHEWLEKVGSHHS